MIITPVVFSHGTAEIISLRQTQLSQLSTQTIILK